MRVSNHAAPVSPASHPSRRAQCALLRMRSVCSETQTFAGVSCTDLPQPQAETWFGLLKMNWACILSAL